MFNNEMLEQLKTIQNSLNEYIESGSNAEENFQNLQKILKDQNIIDKLLILVIHLIAQIASNHHQETNFLSKIEQILLILNEKIKQRLNNLTIYNVFKYSKRILLFLIKEGLLTIDDNISSEFLTGKFIYLQYPHYFFPEIKPFLSKFDDLHKNLNKRNVYYDTIKEFEDFIKEYSEKFPDNYYEKRLIGENDEFICNLIRNDLIDEFISYVNQEYIGLNQEIDISIYETNHFLLKHGKEKLTLIEYAAFFGSIQIFKYLELNGAEITPSIWLFSVHSDNPELFHHLIEMQISPEDDFYEKVFKESIKCHHNGLANYIMDNFLQNDKISTDYFFRKYLKYYNFAFIENDKLHKELFYHFCQYDYVPFIEELIGNNDIDINKYYKVNDDDYEQKTALHIAIENNNFEIVKVLLSDAKIDVNLKSKNILKASDFTNIYDYFDEYIWVILHGEFTPLFCSVEAGNIDIFKLLLEMKNIDINIKCKMFNKVEEEHSANYSVLSYAIKKQNIEMIQILLSNEKLENDSIIEYDMKKAYDKREEGKYECFTPFNLAIEVGNRTIISHLINSEKFDVNHPKNFFSYLNYNDTKEGSCLFEKIKMTPIISAIQKDDFEIVEILLSAKNIDINCFYEYEKNDVAYKNLKVFENIKMKKIDECIHLGSKEYIRDMESNKNKIPTLNYAIEIGNMKVFECLYHNKKIDTSLESERITQKYFKYNKNDIEKKVKLTVIQEAIYNKKIDILNFLLQDDKIDVNYPVHSWTYPCKFESNFDEIKKIEIDKDQITKNILKDKYEIIPPLNYALSIRCNEAAKLLVSSERIDINLKSINIMKIIGNDETSLIKKSSLYEAVFYDNLEIAELLLFDKRLDKKTIDYFCYKKWYDTIIYVTPFQYAIERGNINMVNLFLKSGIYDIDYQKSSFYERNKNTDKISEITGHEKEFFHYLKSPENEYVSYQIKRNAIHIAIEMNHLEILKTLLSNMKVDMNIRNEIIIETINKDGEEEKILKKETPLLTAMKLKFKEIVNFLLDNKYADINSTNNYVSLSKYEKTDNDKIEKIVLEKEFSALEFKIIHIY